MKISKSIETKEGTVQFVGEIDGPELDIVLQMGLMYLVARGAIKAEVVPHKGEQH